MEIAILICCGAVLVLLTVLLLRSGGGTAELEKQIALLRESVVAGERQSMDQMARQDASSSERVTALGEVLREAQERQRARTEDALEKMREELEASRRETGERLTQIERVVTVQMQEILDRKLNEAFDTVVRNMSDLGKGLNDAQERQERASTERIRDLEGEFARIRADILAALDKVREEETAGLERVRAQNQASLDKIDQTVNEKLQKTLDDRISRSFAAVNERLTQVYEGLGEMRTVASGVSDLKNVLSNVKDRGILGEIQLGAILGDILAPEQYEEQFHLIPGKPEMVDFAVRLPGPEDGEPVYLPIDSKFPGDTYAALNDAYASGDPEELKRRRSALAQEMKRCARSIRDKYIVPPRSTDFAILFLPFEGLYAEVVNMGMVEVLQREYRVNITGPSTMAAMLNSLQMGFRTLAIQKKSGEVWKILEAAKKEFATFQKGLDDARRRLQQADDELEKLVGTRTRAIERKLRTVSVLDEGEDAARILDLPPAGT